MLRVFVKGPWYSTFITAKYEYSTQNSFTVKLKFAGKCGHSSWSTLYDRVPMQHSYTLIIIDSSDSVQTTGRYLKI